MVLTKDINKNALILIILLLINCNLTAENGKLTFKYEDSINNEWFLVTLGQDYNLELIDMHGEKINQILDDQHIIKEVQSFIKIKDIWEKSENSIPVINSDVTESLILYTNKCQICFLFYDNFIPVTNNTYNRDAINIIKKLITFVKNNNENKLASIPDWLYD